MKKLLLILFLFLSSIVYSTTYYTVSDGYWESISTWKTNIVPRMLSTDTIYIDNIVVFKSNKATNNGYIIVNPSGYLNLSNKFSNNGKIDVYGILYEDNIINNYGDINIFVNGYMYVHNHVYNYGDINLQGGDICWGVFLWIGNPLTGYGYVCGSPYGPLPIELISFNVQLENNYVKIVWSTANEENNDYFTIEKSKDLITWFLVDSIKGSLYSQGILNYLLFDNEPFIGKSYYRLSQTDIDGTMEVFNNFIRFIQYDNNLIYIYPNPAINQLFIKFNEKIFVLDLYDTNWHKIDIELPIGNTINTFKLKSGTYYIIIN